jgi:GNAT superfamily N-acetyltransferase
MPEKEVNITAATAADAEAISRVVVRALREVNARDYPPGIIDAVAANFTPEAILEHTARRTVLVAGVAGEIVGTASLDSDRVRSVFVRPDHHGKGIGAALMQKVESLAAAKGLRRLVLSSSITAEGFYRRLGYAAVRHEFHGEERTIVMEKYLRAS